MKIYEIDYDEVIEGVVAIGSMEYSESIDRLVPLISRTEFQRKLQDKTFYEKLERDITNGCIMPPITIAYVDKSITKDSSLKDIESYFEKNHSKSFVLDGIQRLNTLSRIAKDGKKKLDGKLYVNVIFCDKVDKLLYRMITLNNGQKPMTPRHQVEVMMANVYDFDGMGITFQTEKERAQKIKMNSFNKSDLIQAYLAFMANSPMVDNKKIIQEKMDELIVNKIISSKPSGEDNKFEDVLHAVSKFQSNSYALKWLKQANNLVGFAVGMRKSSKAILDQSADEFGNRVKIFDESFSDFNPSKIKLGKFSRELSFDYFSNFAKLKGFGRSELLMYFYDLTSE